MLSSNELTIIGEIRRELTQMRNRMRKIIGLDRTQGLDTTTLEKTTAYLIMGQLDFIIDGLVHVEMFAGHARVGLDKVFRMRRILFDEGKGILWNAVTGAYDGELNPDPTPAVMSFDFSRDAHSNAFGDAQRAADEAIYDAVGIKPIRLVPYPTHYVGYVTDTGGSVRLESIAHDRMLLPSESIKLDYGVYWVFVIGPVTATQQSQFEANAFGGYGKPVTALVGRDANEILAYVYRVTAEAIIAKQQDSGSQTQPTGESEGPQ